MAVGCYHGDSLTAPPASTLHHLTCKDKHFIAYDADTHTHGFILKVSGHIPSGVSKLFGMTKTTAQFNRGRKKLTCNTDSLLIISVYLPSFVSSNINTMRPPLLPC